jgi:hypothetical protein
LGEGIKALQAGRFEGLKVGEDKKKRMALKSLRTEARAGPGPGQER